MEQNLDKKIPTLTNIVLRSIAKEIQQQAKELKGKNKTEIAEAVTSKWLDSGLLNEDLIELIKGVACWGNDFVDFCVNNTQAFEVPHAFSPTISCLLLLDNDRVVAASAYGSLCIWNYKTNISIKIKDRHTKYITALILLPNGNFASASGDTTIKLWDSNGTLLNTLEGHKEKVCSLIALPNGNIVSGSSDHTIRTWDSKTGECLDILENENDFDLQHLTIVNDKYITPCRDAAIKIGKFNQSEPIILPGHIRQIMLLKCTQNAQLVSSANDNTLRIWDTESGECLHTFIHTNAQNRFYWATNVITSIDDIVIASFKFIIKVWRLSTEELVHGLEGHTDDISSLERISDTIIASSSSDSTIRIWDINSGKCLHVITIKPKNITHTLIEPSGLLLAATSKGDLYAYYLGNSFEDKLFYLSQFNNIKIEQPDVPSDIDYVPSDIDEEKSAELKEVCLLQ